MILPLLLPLLLSHGPTGLPPDCKVLASRTLKGAKVTFEQHLAECTDPDIDIPMLGFWLCANGVCTNGMCDHTASGPPNTPNLEDYGDLDQVTPSADRSGLLVLMRDGQGNYPTLAWLSFEDGQPMCTEVEGEEQVMKRAGRFLKPDESFGFRGGNMAVQDGLAFWTRGIYAKDDPSCCPSRGFLKITAKLGKRLHFVSANRLPPDAFDDEQTDVE
jgi:hypothetical protein